MIKRKKIIILYFLGMGSGNEVKFVVVGLRYFDKEVLFSCFRLYFYSIFI